MRRTALRRSAPLRTTKLAGKRRDTGPDAQTRALVAARSGGRCELCGALGEHLHHRQLRRAGDHSAANLVHLCNTCHRRIHGHVSWSLQTGWLVSQYRDPARVPLLLDDEWVYLDRDGTTTPAPPLTENLA